MSLINDPSWSTGAPANFTTGLALPVPDDSTGARTLGVGDKAPAKGTRNDTTTQPVKAFAVAVAQDKGASVVPVQEDPTPGRTIGAGDRAPAKGTGFDFSALSFAGASPLLILAVLGGAIFLWKARKKR